MNNFTEQERQARIKLIIPIVEAAFGIRGRTLPSDELQKQAIHWEASFSCVATPHLRDLYKVGVEAKATTAAEFEAAWMKWVNETNRAKKLRSSTTPPKRDASKHPIPPSVLDSWRKGVQQ